MKRRKIVQNLIKTTSEQIIYVSIIYPEVVFNADDYKQPFQYRFKNYYNYLTTKIQGIDEIFLGNNILNQDAGIIFQDTEEFKESSIIRIINKPIIPTIEPTDISKIDYTLNNSPYQFYFIFDKNYYFHTRIYSKFQDLLANVNGFMELVIFLLGFFYKIYNQYRLDIYLFKRLIFIKDYNKDLENDNKLKSVNLNTKSITEKIPIKPHKEINIQNLKTLDKNSSLKAGNTSDISNINIDLKNSIISKNDKLFANNSGRSFILNNENNELKEIQEKKIKVASENVTDLEFVKTICGFFAFKNNITFKFIDYLKFCLKVNGTKKDQNHIPILQLLEKFAGKISDKFDIFYYLKKIKQFKLFKRFYCNEEHNSIIKIFLNKIYSINPNEIEKHEDFYISKKEKQKEQKLINFLKNNIEDILYKEKLLDLIL